MSNKNINFSFNEIKRLFDNYGLNAFNKVVKTLIMQKRLSGQEKSFLMVLMKGIKNKSFFCKSYLIYLSNGIIKGIGEIEKLKQQLFFELMMLSLKENIIKKIDYNNSQNLYSLMLNRMINYDFDLIEKKDEHYIFSNENVVVLKTKENDKLKISEDVNFLIKNKNPFHLKISHPNIEFIEYSLGNKSLDDWVHQFKNAYGIVKDYSSEVYKEVNYFLQEIIPIGYLPQIQASSSYTSCPGIIYLSYTEHDVIQAEAMIHEANHNIYNIVESFHPFLRNSTTEQYYSSYRPDARPLRGCFLGLHAFVAVQNFYSFISKKNNYSKSFEGHDLISAFLDAYIKNKKMIEVIGKYGKFDEEGALFFGDIKTKFFDDVDYFENMSKKYSEKFEKVSKTIDNHFETAKKENSILLY